MYQTLILAHTLDADSTQFLKDSPPPDMEDSMFTEPEC